MEVSKHCGSSECKNELGCLIAEELRQNHAIEIPTSRGIIRIVDDHIFEIQVPNHEQLVLSFPGENLAFRVGGWVENIRDTGKKPLTLPETVA